MMHAAGRSCATERLVDLERTVDSLNGQLREMQWELYRPKAEPLPVRLWRSLVSRNGRQEFMSTVFNRRVRPNTKMLSHAGSRT